MGLKGLNHVALAVRDGALYEKTVDFYANVLGLPLVRRWGNPPKHITMLDLGNCMLEVIFGAEGAGEGAIPHMALETGSPEEVDAMLAKCAAAGCAVTRPADDVDRNEDLHGMPMHSAQGRPFRLRNGFCRGPAGETLEFFCQKP